MSARVRVSIPLTIPCWELGMLVKKRGAVWVRRRKKEIQWRRTCERRWVTTVLQ